MKFVILSETRGQLMEVTLRWRNAEGDDRFFGTGG